MNPTKKPEQSIELVIFVVIVILSFKIAMPPSTNAPPICWIVLAGPQLLAWLVAK